MPIVPTIDASRRPARRPGRPPGTRLIPPMRAAVITDIHSNQPALEAVLAAIDEVGADEIWCLGDVVGYGASPDRCTEIVRERCELCLVGNHDLAVLGALDISAFSAAAAEAVTWTQEEADESTIEFLRPLQPSGRTRARSPCFMPLRATRSGSTCSRSSRPPTASQIQPQRISLIGHSHVALYFTGPDEGAVGDVRGAQAMDGAGLDLGEGPLADKPRQRRPAARRRPTRRLAGARHRSLDGALSPGRVRDRPRRPGDRRSRAAEAARRSPLCRSVGSAPCARK